jgi:HEAT repeat protein
LLRSNDGGVTWQPVDSAILAEGVVATVAVTAVAIDPEDEQIVYAATGIWLGTHTAHLSPVGVAVSVDGGREWLQMSRAKLSNTQVWRLEPVAGQPLSVVTVSSTGSYAVSLEMSPELMGLLHDGSPAVRASAARAIGLLGDPAALPGLMRALADPDALAAQRIAEAIGRIGDRSVSADLLSVLGSAPAAERARAAQALGLLKSAEAVPGLAALLSVSDPDTQRVAAEALATIGTPAAMAALMAPLADQQMTSARHAALGGLEMAGQSAVAPLAAALLDRNAVVRANAAEMLGWLRAADAVAYLARLLSDPHPAVQAQAAWALGEIGTGPARLALNPAPGPAPDSAPILGPIAARPIAPAPLTAWPDVPCRRPPIIGPWRRRLPCCCSRAAGVRVDLKARPASHLGST